MLVPLNKGIIVCANNCVFAGCNSVKQLANLTDIPAQYVHPSTIQCNASTEIESLKSSVSSGKTLVANAITDKGVATSSSDTFATMANNISQIASAPKLVGSGALTGSSYAATISGGCNYAECSMYRTSSYTTTFQPQSFTVYKGGRVSVVVTIRYSSYESYVGYAYISLSSDGVTISLSGDADAGVTFSCYTQ